MRKLLFITSFFVFFLICTQPVDAAILEKTSDREYTLTEDKVSVKETITNTIIDPQFYIPAGSEETFIIFNPLIDDNEADEKISKTLPSISVKDSFGNPLSYSTEVDGQNILVKVNRNTRITFGSTQKVILEYNSYSLFSKTGAIYDIYIPSFSEDFEFSDETSTLTINSKLIIPKKLGELGFVIPEKAPKSAGDNWEIAFSQQDLTGILSWVQVGTEQIYTFEIKQPYIASGNVDIFENRYSVLLPRDITSGPITQKVFFTEMSPSPGAIRLDKDSNLVAEYVFPASESGEISIKGYATVNKTLDFEQNDFGNLSDIPQTLVKTLTTPAEFWETEASSIINAAHEIQGEESDVLELITKTYEYVIERIDYSDVKRFGLNERQGALRTLEGGAAVCMEYSDLFIALMRAQGIPARAAFGYGYDARATDEIDTAHQWAEVYIPSQDSWIAVDTTWGESGPAIIGGDLNHFYKFIASTSPESPSPVEVTFYGSLTEIPDEEFTINATDTIPSGATMSQEDLLGAFPREPELKITTQILASITTAREKVDSWLEDLYAPLNLEPNILSFAKVVSYMTPLFLLILFYLIRAFRRPIKEPRVVAKQVIAT